ncbi:helix-turn-helix domain-containing protein [Enterococcus casseliflavus]|uniref:helix-turn-helix domain-containing protein n=1 Tax=Enterococcus casseliflavus TaxID=37734 RepID=UPI003EE098F4
MRDIQISFITNKMIARWMRILNVIEQEKQFTINDLSENLNISKRTLIKDLSELKSYFSDSAELSSTNTGYLFIESNRVIYKDKKSALLDNEIWFEVFSDIFFGELEDIDELADRYNLSESTMQRVFKQAINKLEKYEIGLSQKPVDFIGNEGNIRKFIFDFFFEGEPTNHTVYPPEDFHNSILKSVKRKLKSFSIDTSASIYTIYYNLYISMIRSKSGNKIDLPDIVYNLNIDTERDLLVLSTIQLYIQEEYDIRLHKNEIFWLYLIHVTQRKIDNLEQEKNFYNRLNHWPAINTIVEKFFLNIEYPNIDRIALESLVRSFLLTIKINDTVCPILNKLLIEEKEAIIKYYPNSYKNIYSYLSTETVTSLAISPTYIEDIACSMTLFLETVSIKYSSIKTILFILEGNHLLVQLIYSQAKSLLKGKYKLLFFPIQNFTLDKFNMKDVDLIITNYRPYILDKYEKDYLLINNVPNKDDWVNIITKLNPLLKSVFE